MNYINVILTLFLIVAPLTYLGIVFYHNKKSFKTGFIPLVIILIFSIILLRKLVFSGLTLAQADANHFNLPFFEFFGRSILQYQEPPIWNPSFDAGFDMFSHPLNNYLSPTSSFSFIKNIYFGWNLKIVTEVLLAGITSFLLFYQVFKSSSLGLIGAITYTFNGYTVQRLSEGLGTEYLFSIKWFPLLILFAYKLSKDHKIKNLLLLATAMAFSFDGSPNVAFYSIIGAFVFYLTLISRKNILNYIFYFLLSGTFAFLIYAIKIIPAIGIYGLNAGNRLTQPIVGHRTLQVSFTSFLKYLIPFVPEEGLIPVFSPGVFALILVSFGFISIIIKKARPSPKPEGLDLQKPFGLNGLDIAFSSILITGIILTTINPVSQFIVNLPIFNRVTPIPATISLIVIALPFFAATGAKFLFENTKILLPLFGFIFALMFFVQDKILYRILKTPDSINNIIKIAALVIIPLIFWIISILISRVKESQIFSTNMLYSMLVALLIFIEILFGPATFGTSSYSFNFPKFNYQKEMAEYKHLDRLKELQNKGERAYFTHHNRNYLVVAPAYTTLDRDLEVTSNNPYYFAPSWTVEAQAAYDKTLKFENEFWNEELWNLGSIKYIVLTNEIEKEPNYKYLENYLVDAIPFVEFKEHKELTTVFNMKDLYPWDGKTVKIFENPKYIPRYAFIPENGSLDNFLDVEIINESTLNIELKVPEEAGQVLISRTYYPYWKAWYDRREIAIEKNEAYMKVYVNGDSDRLIIRYVPTHIYTGFIISLTSLTVILHLLKRKYV